MLQPTCPAKDSGVFRFTDLPAEIRNAVYEILLCSYPSCIERIRYRHNPGLNNKQLLHPAILRINRKYGNEARAVMLKRGLFVRVDADLGQRRYVPFMDMLTSRKIPVFHRESKIDGRSYTCPLNNRILAMRYTIRDSSVRTHNYYREMHQIRLLMLHRHLEELCLHFGDLDIALEESFAACVHHQVSLYGDPSAGFSAAAQAQLLQPFMNHIRGVPHFNICPKIQDTTMGNTSTLAPTAAYIEGKLIQRTLEAVQTAIPKTPSAQLSHLNTMRARGDTAYKVGNVYMAEEYWQHAARYIDRLRRTDWFRAQHIRRLQPSQGGCRESDEFAKTLTELRFGLVLKKIETTIETIEDEYSQGNFHYGRNLVQGGLNLVDGLLVEGAVKRPPGVADGDFESMVAGDARGGWRPSKLQMGDVWLCQAKLLRLGKQFAGGLRAIGWAKLAAPGDEKVLEEEMKILKEKTD